jgi:hypothetical protein
VLLTLLPAASVPAQAEEMQRVRTDSPYLRLVIASGMRRSPTIRAIVGQLEQSDLIVAVECGRFTNATRLAGRTALLSAQPTVRYVGIEIACPVMSVPALCAIGHELWHALEIATASWVVDDETLAHLYEQIGFPTDGTNTIAYGQYETAEALDAGERVHHELFHPSESTRQFAQSVTK